MTYEERLEFFHRNSPLVIKLMNDGGVYDEDSQQEVFLKYWTVIDKYNPNLGKESTFVSVVIKNFLLNLKLRYYRHEGRDKYYCITSSTALTPDGEVTIEDTLIDDSTESIDDMIALTDFYNELNLILKKLHKNDAKIERDRDIYVRRVLEGELLRTIGESHNLSKQRVNMIVFKINKLLSESLREWATL